MIQMLVLVVEDMKYFFAIFIWAILGFIFSLNIMQNRANEDAEILSFFFF